MRGRLIGLGRGRERGFTLIELAIVLVIVGMLLVGLIQGLKLYTVQKKMDDTSAHIDEVRSALADYIRNERDPATNPNDEIRFPCPAGLTVAEGAANYGVEVANCEDYGSGAEPLGNLAGTGVWAAPSPVDPARSVLIGAVPTSTLGIPARYGYDGYGNRLVYAVTLDLVAADALMAVPVPTGAIQIQNASGGGANAEVNFVVLSPGRTHEGAYARSGALIAPCGAGSDSQNCGWQTAGSPALFRDANSFSLATTGAGAAQYYDDRLEFTLGADDEDRWWGPTEPNTEIDIVNRSNTDSVVIRGQNNRSKLLVNHTGSMDVERDAHAGSGAEGFSEEVTIASADPAIALDIDSHRMVWFMGKDPTPGDDSLSFGIDSDGNNAVATDIPLRLTPTPPNVRGAALAASGDPAVVIGGDYDAPASGGNCGTQLHFAGVPHNSDTVFIHRCNVGQDRTELRFFVGDNTDTAYDDTVADSFVIGGLDAHTSAWTELFRVRSDGRVGIGTQTPKSTLDLRGGLHMLSASSPSLVGLTVQVNPSDESAFDEEIILSGNNFDNGQRGDNRTSIFIGPNSRGGGVGRIELDAKTVFVDHASVGIGTRTPATKLDVKGAIKPGNQAQSGSCTAAKAGAMRYNAATKAMQYCDRSVWKRMGGDPKTYRINHLASGGCPSGFHQVGLVGWSDNAVRLCESN